MTQTSNHPLVTKKLEKQRRRQRRTLATIEDRAFREAMKGLPAKPSLPESPAVRGLVEEAIRAHVDSQMDEQLKDLLSSIADDYVALNLALFLQAAWDETDPVDRDRFPLVELLKQSNEAATPKSRAKINQQGPALAAVVAGLVWADELAGDYRDSRLEA